MFASRTLLKSRWSTKSLMWSYFCFQNFGNFSEWAACNVICVIKCIPTEVQFRCYDFPSIFPCLFLRMFFIFLSDTDISLLVRPVVLSSSTRLEVFWILFSLLLLSESILIFNFLNSSFLQKERIYTLNLSCVTSSVVAAIVALLIKTFWF